MDGDIVKSILIAIDVDDASKGSVEIGCTASLLELVRAAHGSDDDDAVKAFLEQRMLKTLRSLKDAAEEHE